MTEAASDEKIVISSVATQSNETIAERKSIVYQTRIEPNVIETIGDKIKTQLFTRFGFMKPRVEEIQLVSVDKYYEPYMAISGRYMIDYYRKCRYTVKIDNRVQEVILSNQKYNPDQPADSHAKDHKEIRLQGEERLTTELKASLILDRFGQEVALKELPSAPPEENPKEILAPLGLREIDKDTDLDIIRSKILRRPKDINRILVELFEVSERAVIYTPRYRVLYTNVRTGEVKAVEFDAITAQRTQRPRPLPQYTRRSM